MLRITLAPLLASGLLAVCSSAHALVFEVTKSSDTADGACDADCSLREAVQAANATPGADEIVLRGSFYRLAIPNAAGDEDAAATGDLDLTDAVFIRGSSDGTVIDADGIDRLFEVLPGVTAELRFLTLRDGQAAGLGGAVYNAGDLIIRRSYVHRSRVLEAGGRIDGGGIYNAGILQLLFSWVYENDARSTGAVTGRGAGLFNEAGARLTVLDSNIRENVTAWDGPEPGVGGGIYNLGIARVDRSMLGWNKAGTGEGSAIANRDGGTLAVLNTTISANGLPDAVGAIANGPGSETRLTNVTIANNNGGGLYNTGRVLMRNTIIAGNFTNNVIEPNWHSGTNCLTGPGGYTSQTYSLIGADGNCPAYIFVDNSRVFREVLEHLAYVGGPTPVHVLRPGPYGIDNGDPANCPMWDQRQGRRPADGDMNDTEICDIGAMEVGADE